MSAAVNTQFGIQIAADNDGCGSACRHTNDMQYPSDSVTSSKSLLKIAASGMKRRSCRGGAWLDQLLGIGGNGGGRSVAQCPAGSRIIGYQAAAFCLGITEFQVTLSA